MKKRLMRMLCLDVFLCVLFFLALHCASEVPVSKMELKIVYGEFHANLDGGTSQLFWAGVEEGFAEERSMMCNMKELDSSVTFQLPEIDLENARFRFDPFMNSEPFSFERVEVSIDGERMATIWGDEFAQDITGYEHVEWSDGEGRFVPLTEDPVLYLGDGFNTRIIESWRGDIYSFENVSFYVFLAVFVIWLEAGMLLYARRHNMHAEKKSGGQLRNKKIHVAGVFVSAALLCLGVALIYGAYYLRQNFADISLVELIYYANTQLKGTNVSTFHQVIFDIAGIVAGTIALVVAGDRLLGKEQKQKGYPVWMISFAVVCMVYAAALADHQLDIKPVFG